MYSIVGGAPRCCCWLICGARRIRCAITGLVLTRVITCQHVGASARAGHAHRARADAPMRSSDAGRARGLAVVRCRKTKVVEAEAYPPRYDVITLDPHDTLQKGGAKARDRTTSRSQNSRAEELRESRQQQRGQRTAQYQIVGSRSQLCPCPLTAQRPRRDARVAATASKLMRTLVTAMVFRRDDSTAALAAPHGCAIR